MKKIVMIMCACLLTFGITGCSSTKEELIEESYQDANGKTVSRRGQTITIDDWEVTYKSSGVATDTEDSSVYFDITVKNNGSETRPFTKWMDMSGTAVAAYIVDEEYQDINGYAAVKLFGGDNSDVTDTDIAPGEELKGKLYFSSPEISTEDFNNSGYYLLLLASDEEYGLFKIEEVKYK